MNNKTSTCEIQWFADQAATNKEYFNAWYTFTAPPNPLKWYRRQDRDPVSGFPHTVIDKSQGFFILHTTIGSAGLITQLRSTAESRKNYNNPNGRHTIAVSRSNQLSY
jgi:hypothetical protein